MRIPLPRWDLYKATCRTYSLSFAKTSELGTSNMVKTVDATWLSQRVSSSSDDVLVLDTRTAEQFNSGYINGAVHICCAGVILRRLRKGNLCIEALLNCSEDKDKYERAKVSENVCVVVCDHSTSSAEQLPTDSIAALLLKKLSRECKFTGFLAGGYVEFHRLFANRCVVPNSPEDSLLKKRPSSLVLQLTNLQLSVASGTPSSPDDSSPNSKDFAPFEILPHLYLGCRKVATHLENLKEARITRILNVTSSVPNQFEHLKGFSYRQIAVEDSHDVNMLQHLPEAFSFIEDAKANSEKVLVHCHAGMSRSVTVILAYLMKNYGHTLDSAYEFVKERKSDISPNFSFMGQLLEYECSLRPSPVDSGIGSSTNSPVEGHCFVLSGNSPSLSPISRPCILAA